MWRAHILCGYRSLLSVRNLRQLSLHFEKAGVSLKQGTDSVEITWKRRDDTVPSYWSKFHHMWLRDNCQCTECYHPETHQRLLDTFNISIDVKPRSVELSESRGCGGSLSDTRSLTIEWEDGHKSNYPLAWLKAHSYEWQGEEEQSESPLECEDGVTTWGKEISNASPMVDYDSFMKDDRAFLEWSDKVHRYGFCFVDGIPLELLSSRRVIERMGVLRHTFYGDMWDIDVTSKPTDDIMEHGDTAYTAMGIDSHTDGNYFRDAPGLQMLHVTYFNGTGGESVLVDGFKLAQVIKEENPDHYHILSTVLLDYQYKDKDNRYLNSYVPFTLNPDTGNISQVHFNNYDRSPISARTVQALRRMKPSGSIANIYEAIQTFLKTMREREYQYRFHLEPGRAVIFDNHRVLHARTAFTGRRRLCGGYVNREDWKSRVMVTSNKLTDCK